MRIVSQGRFVQLGLWGAIFAIALASYACGTTDPGPIKCPPTLSPAQASLSASGGSATVSVSFPNQRCEWKASSTDNWLRITSGGSGTGDGIIGYNVDANPGGQRMADLTITSNTPSSATTTITQTAAPCTYTITPTTQSANSLG